MKKFTSIVDMARAFAPETVDMLLEKIPYEKLRKILEPAMEAAARGLYDKFSGYNVTYEQFMSIVFYKMSEDLTRKPQDFLDWVQKETSQIDALKIPTLLATLGDCVQQTVSELDRNEWQFAGGRMFHNDVSRAEYPSDV